MAETYDLAPLIRETRHMLGLSQRELAEILKVGSRTLQKWEYDLTIPHRGYREWIAGELRRLQRTRPRRLNRTLNRGAKPGPTNIWSKLSTPNGTGAA